ncbi:aristolochene synthase [Colletotrichum orchidophilum]|uniref:Aristolochene synthase n=1 Tax=Colletotrichum orchidophilum TaxID=1209926 RepID=A0A1G4BSS2_9PEZI|nr:aristolochene synthase [Colletotrichum orchidophilum]OHF04484.1 aristolochene synthase [Colletotrichum orchidophilum]
MLKKDEHLAVRVLKPIFVLMRAQTEKIRTEITELVQYLHLLSALMCFAMGLHLTDEEVADMKEVEMNYAKHVSIINEIYIWEKGLKQSQVSLEEGSTSVGESRCSRTARDLTSRRLKYASEFLPGSGN